MVDAYHSSEGVNGSADGAEPTMGSADACSVVWRSEQEFNRRRALNASSVIGRVRPVRDPLDGPLSLLLICLMFNS